MADVQKLHQLRLPDGRLMAWASYGAADGTPVVALHGTPGSHLKFRLASDVASRLGLRLIAVDRWGYGGSDRPQQPALSGYADDIALLADAIGAKRIGVFGVSGGGPYAVATAAALGARVAALALVAPVGPIVVTHDPPVLSPFHTICFRVLPHVPGAVRLVFAAFKGALAVSGKGALAIAAARASATDRRVACDPAAHASLIDAFREGLSNGLDGPVIDMRLFSRAWDVAPATVVSATRLWLGDSDNNVPQTAARRLARQIANCDFVELAGQGHLWIAHHYDDVLTWLAMTMATTGHCEPGSIRPLPATANSPATGAC